MEELIIKLDIPKEFKEEFKLALAIIIKEFVRGIRLLELEQMRNRLDSKEEQELTKWSVERGRKVNKEAFDKLASRLPKNKQEKLLK